MRFLIAQLRRSIAGFPRVDEQNGQALINQSIWPMLHLARRITLSVNVRELFQFQRAFQSNRKIDSAAEIKKIGAPEELFREVFDGVRFVEQVFHLNRQLRELLRVFPAFIRRERPAQLAHIQRKQVKRNHLRRKGLGRRDANLRSRVREDRAVGFARDHRALNVANRKNFCPALLHFTKRGDRVGGLA